MPGVGSAVVTEDETRLAAQQVSAPSSFVTLPSAARGDEPSGASSVTARHVAEAEALRRFDRRSLAGQVSLLLVIFACVGALAVGFTMAERYIAGIAFTRGVAEFGRGENDQALERFVRAVQFEERNALYWRVLSEASLSAFLAETQRVDAVQADQAQKIQQLATQAMVAADRATALTPEHPGAWAQRGRVLSALLPFGWEGAAEALPAAWERAAALDPKNPFYTGEIGGAYLILWEDAGRRGVEDAQRAQYLERAEAFFRKALRKKADYAPAHYQLATIANLRGKTDEAIAKLEDAVRSAPLDAGFRFQLGLLYYHADRVDDAQQQFAQAVALNPDYANAHYYLGLIADKQGRRDEAIREFEWLAEKNPDLDILKTILKNLRAGRPALEGVSGISGVGHAPITQEPQLVPPEPGLSR